jgi:two-component system chemotaxis response regulator CheB
MTINILLADDSSLVRHVLSDILHARHDLRVIGCASNGREAVEMTLALSPDLVVIDLLMPVLDGIGAIEEIMAHAPTPVLVLHAAADPKDVERALSAVKHGALQVMEKPVLTSAAALDHFALRFVEAVQLLSGIRVIRRPLRKPRRETVDRTGPGGTPTPNLLAIGASTGGPKAVMSLLKSLPADFPATVFIVQHIAEGFAEGFATWLNRECTLPVRLAVDGAKYSIGEALVAPNGCHMTVSDGRIWLTRGAPVNCCRPSIDVFFASLALRPCDQVVGLLLSGMGKDGAQGLLGIKKRGGMTLVQDEPSCAIFGMPKAALHLDAVNEVLHIEAMPAALAKLFTPP